MVVKDITISLMERKHQGSSAQFQRGTVTPLPALHTSATGEGSAAFWWDAKPEGQLLSPFTCDLMCWHLT